MTNIVKFTGKQPEPKTGPYWAGEPMEKAFPGRKVRKPAYFANRHLVMFEGELCYLEDDGPEGAA
jgi:hypothetical protein